MAGAAAEAEELRLTIERAAQGDAAALMSLACRHEDGDGVAQDQAEALRLYAQAAAQGDARA
jgi:TPR repeat protein